MALPKGWRQVSLGEVAAIQSGVTKNSQSKVGGPVVEVPYLRVANVQRGALDLEEVKTIAVTPDELEALRLQPGDILFNEGGDRDKLGRGWVWGGQIPDCIHQNHVFRARLHSSDILPRFVSWYANSVGQSYFLAHAKQTTNLASINQKILKALPLVLPPREEQVRIVAEIDTQFSRLDATEARLNRALVNLKRARASVLKAAVEGRLVPTEADIARQEGRQFESGRKLLCRIVVERQHAWMVRYPKRKYLEPAQVEDENLPRLPEGWIWSTIDQLAWSSGYGTSVKCLSNAEGPPVLRIPNVQRGVIDLNDLKNATEPSKLDQDGALEPGDLIFIRTNGSLRLIGLGACVLQPLSTPTWFASYLIRLRMCGEPQLWRWLTLVWNGPIVRKYIERDAASSAGQFNVSLSAATLYAVPLPPLAEQHRIVAEVDRRLSVLDRLEARITANLSRCQRLRQAILKRAFEGRLVPQDPT